ASRQNNRRHHYHRDRPDSGLWRQFWRRPQTDPDRLRSQHRLCRQFLLSLFLQLRRRGRHLMQGGGDEVAGFYAPVHRALTEPILLGGAPRTIAIANGTLAAAIGLGLQLWIVG